jgi:hypothetical protein
MISILADSGVELATASRRLRDGGLSASLPGTSCLYVYSGPIVLVLVLVLGWGIEAGLPGWKREERRKQAAEGSLGPPEKRTRTKDEDEHDWDMALNRYSCLATISLSLRDKSHSPIEAPDNYLSLT